MNRHVFSAALACVVLAGCVRSNGDDFRSAAPRPGAAGAPASAVRSVEEAQAPAPPAPTGSRLLPSPEMLTDAVITAGITASMLADPLLRGADVSVNTTQGVVNLTGSVVSQEQAAIASSHAQRQDGVMRVDDHLSVNLR